MPKEFSSVLEYIKKLDFTEKPDYDSIIESFREVLEREGMEEDGIFDWETSLSKSILKQKKTKKIKSSNSDSDDTEENSDSSSNSSGSSSMTSNSSSGSSSSESSSSSTGQEMAPYLKMLLKKGTKAEKRNNKKRPYDYDAGDKDNSSQENGKTPMSLDHFKFKKRLVLQNFNSNYGDAHIIRLFKPKASSNEESKLDISLPDIFTKRNLVSKSQLSSHRRGASLSTRQRDANPLPRLITSILKQDKLVVAKKPNYSFF